MASLGRSVTLRPHSRASSRTTGWSLAPKILSYVQNGMSADTIAIELQNTSEYKQRFGANDARVKAGLPALSPSEYLATERSYRQIMQAAGMPLGFYDDSPNDFSRWLEMDVSPTEVKARVDAASEAINNALPKPWTTSNGGTG